MIRFNSFDVQESLSSMTENLSIRSFTVSFQGCVFGDYENMSLYTLIRKLQHHSSLWYSFTKLLGIYIQIILKTEAIDSTETLVFKYQTMTSCPSDQ